MAKASLIGDDGIRNSRSTPPTLTLATMREILPGGFPAGGKKNLQGILGLFFPNLGGAAGGAIPPYCVNGSKPSTGPQGRTCVPTAEMVSNVPFVQQLVSLGVVIRPTIGISFKGTIADGDRYGLFTVGDAAPAEAQLLPLQKVYGISPGYRACLSEGTCCRFQSASCMATSLSTSKGRLTSSVASS